MNKKTEGKPQEKKQKICRVCHAPLVDDSKFCSQCGMSCSLKSIDYKPLLEGAIVDTFKLDSARQAIRNKIGQQIEADGLEIRFDDKVFLDYTNKLSDLFLLRRLALAIGLGPVAVERILAREIDKKFGYIPNTPPPTPKIPESTSKEQ